MFHSQHFCSECPRYFNADMTDLADPDSHYTCRVVDTAAQLVVEDHQLFVSFATIQN